MRRQGTRARIHVEPHGKQARRKGDRSTVDAELLGLPAEADSIRLLTPRQAAQVLGVSEAFVAKDKSIPRAYLGKQTPRFRVEDLRAWIAKKFQSSTGAVSTSEGALGGAPADAAGGA